MSGVGWLRPVIKKAVITWPYTCEASLVTKQSIDWAIAHGRSTVCKNAARIDYRGVKLCRRHAGILALEELAGPFPEDTK